MEREIALFPHPVASAFSLRNLAADQENESAATGLRVDRAVLDVGPMTEANRLTVAGAMTTVELMENAGSAVAREIRQRWSPGRVTILCGTGGNSDDGFDCLSSRVSSLRPRDSGTPAPETTKHYACDGADEA